MKPTLKIIKQAALAAYGMSEDTFKQFGSTRRANMIAVKRLFCFLATYYGYSEPEVGREIGLSRTTVIQHRSNMESFLSFYESEKELVEDAKRKIEQSILVTGYIARDSEAEGGQVHFFYRKPIRSTGFWETSSSFLCLDQEFYSFITWEHEPFKAELKIRLL